MTAFVLCGHHAAIRPNYMSGSHRSPCTGQRKISYRTSQFCGRSFIPQVRRPRPESESTLSRTTVMFYGGGGILGVGPSEVVVILAVGWLLLGPEKLFSLAKDSGRLLGELRRTATEAKDTLNDAMELDLIAAEFEEGKKLAQENGTPDDSDNDDDNENENDNENDSEDQISDEGKQVVNTSEERVEDGVQAKEVEEDVEPVVNSAFLEQLQRVADPNQKPPEEVPDIDSDLEEELEVQRLEKQYFEARERLEKHRRQRAENKTSESEPVVEER